MTATPGPRTPRARTPRALVRLRRRAAAALVVVLGAVLLTTSAAHAASLTLTAPQRPFVTAKARCTSGPVTVTATGTPNAGQYTQVRVTGITGACATGAVRVATGSGSTWSQAYVSTSATAVSGGALTATGPAFTPPATASGKAFVVLDGWPVPATWTFTPAALPALSCQTYDASGNPLTAPCTATITGGSEWGSPLNTFYRGIRVTTTSTTPVRWRVTITFTDTTVFPFVPQRISEGSGGDALLVAGASTCTPTPVVVMTGNTANGQANVSASNPVQFQIAGTRNGASYGTVILSCA